jgi:competence protein ComEC
MDALHERRWPGVAFLAALVAGPALQLQQPQLWGAAAYAAGVVAGCAGLVLCLRLRGPVARASALACAAVVAFSACGWRAAIYAAGDLPPALEGRDLLVTGTIASLPQRHALGPRFRLAVDALSLDGAPVGPVPSVSLAWYGGGAARGSEGFELQRSAPELRVGDRWRFTVRLRAPHGAVNPHGFDHELWMWEHGLRASGTVRAGAADRPPERIGATWRHPVERVRQRVRDAIDARVDDRQRAGVIAALVVGDQGAIDRADWDVFRATGVAHLMSISGLHVTMFAWLAAGAVGWCWRRSPRLCLAWPAPHAALLGGLGLAAAYALFSGWGVPAQRTLLMLAAVGWLRLSGRRWPWTATWMLACAVVVSADPWALMQPGFWLSFVAVGVLFATDDGGARAGFAARLGALLREQAVVTLALAPLTLLLFGQVSLVGLAANLAAIPWVTLLVTPLAMAGTVLPVLWEVAAAAIGVLQWLLALLAAVPGAVWSQAAPPLWAGCAGVAGGALVAARLPPAVRALGLPLLLPVLLWQAPRPAPGSFELLASDVGQGTAVLVRTAGHSLLYDAGPRYSAESDAGERVLVPLLRALGERLDLLVVSHRDSDHTGGAAAVLAAQPKAGVLASLEEGHPLQALRPVQPCRAGQRWSWDGVEFTVLHPGPAEQALAARRPNAASCVLRIAAGGQAALLAGDIEAPQEARLLDTAAAALPAQVLLVPHHGSRTSSSGAFLDAVGPRWALVQAGYRNRFGHPAPAVVARHAERGIVLVESSRCGAAWWSSAAPERLRCEREAARRYWHHRLP